jgi:hypothetical protein
VRQQTKRTAPSFLWRRGLTLLGSIKLFTAPGDVVLDPFMGSGSTAVAAKQLGRQYVGIELSEEYTRVAQERLEQTTIMENGNGPYRQGDFAQLCQREDCTVPSGEAGSPEKDEPGGGAEEKESLFFRAKNLLCESELVSAVMNAYLTSRRKSFLSIPRNSWLFLLQDTASA